MNLNLGSGEHPTQLDDWVNVDLPWDGVRPVGRFVYGDAFTLPFADGVFDRAYLGHFIEHIWWRDLQRVLDEVARVVVGTVMIVGPAIDRAVAQAEPRWLVDAVVGAGEGPGAHKWVPTEELHVIALELCGWRPTVIDVRDVKPPLWPNPVPHATWQCAISASRSS